MSIRAHLKQAFNRLTGLHVMGALPFGNDQLRDLRTHFPAYEVRMLFDVGANTGQSARQMRSNFPQAVIHCFEPISTTFRSLEANSRGLQVHCHQVALGAFEGEMVIGLKENNEMNSLNEPERVGGTSEKINVTTLSHFCRINSIATIDLLKVDTEGFDLEVLKGAQQLLENASIGFIELELGLSPENTYHVPLESARAFLEQYGYRIFGIYQQTHEWMEQIPVIRRVNAVFVSKKIAAKARGRYAW